MERRASVVGLAFVSCVLCTIPAHASFTKAASVGKVQLTCASGSFFDPRNGGECWKCPSGSNRTVFYPVSSNKACEKPAALKYAESTFKHGWACDSDEFFDPRKGGECWKCPSGHPRRTANAVTSDKACATKEILGETLSSAKFQHKFKGCTGRSFFDPRNGGQCWQCPKGYDRTLEAVTSNHACSALVDDTFSRATKTSSTCPDGAFADPNGSCYTCPSSASLRSIYPVTGDRACASSLREAFVPDAAGAQVMCRSVVSALDRSLKEGEKAKDQLMDVVKPLIEPIRKPLEEKVGEAIDRVASVAKVGDVLDDVGAPVEPYVDVATKYATNFWAKQSDLKNLMLDPNVVCSGDAQKIIAALKKILDDIGGQNFLTVGLGASFKHPLYTPRVNVGLMFATNLEKKGGLYFTVGLSGTLPSEPAPVTVTLSGAYYPRRTLADFALSPIPETGLSFGKGGAWDEAVKQFPPLKALALVDSIDAAWDFNTAHIPAIGISKELYALRPGGRSVFSATGSVGWGIPIVVYDM